MPRNRNAHILVSIAKTNLVHKATNDLAYSSLQQALANVCYLTKHTLRSFPKYYCIGRKGGRSQGKSISASHSQKKSEHPS